MSFQNDQFGVNIDLDLTVFLRPQLPPSNNTVLNRYDRVEGLSGSPQADVLRGTPNPPGEGRGNELVNFALIEGLNDSAPGADDGLVPLTERFELEPDVITGEPQFGWTGGEIILGGAGSDLIVGEGGDDIIDGDAALTVMISTPDPAVRSGAARAGAARGEGARTSTASQAAADLAASGAAGETLAAANAAVTAANALVASTQAEAQLASDALRNTISIRDALGNLITASAEGSTAVGDEWRAFLASCSAVLVDMGLDLQTTTTDSAAEALASQAEALATQTASSAGNLNATATASEAAATAAEAALATAEANLDAADERILVAGMEDVMDAIFAGYINPGELSISRRIVDEDDANADTDIVSFSGNAADYTIDIVTTDPPVGFVVVTDNRVLPLNLRPGRAGNEGRDLLRNIERLQFADGFVILDGLTTARQSVRPRSSGTPAVAGTLTASIVGVTDVDSVPSALTDLSTTVDWTWESELDPVEAPASSRPSFAWKTTATEFVAAGPDLRVDRS